MKKSEFEQLTAIEQLIAIMAMLRDKRYGCPWDLEQSLNSLIPHTLEEVYEVVDAIEKGDPVDMEEELGDLLFQVVFYAQLANEERLFAFDDIARAISSKLVRRHPHVFPGGQVENFGNETEISSEQVEVNWEAIKQQEKEERFTRTGELPATSAVSVLDNVPGALPALQRAFKLQKKAAQSGFDWPEVQPVVEKVKEEFGEFEAALQDRNTEQLQAEFGDIMFALVNLGRHLGIEPEVALRSSNGRFESRFRWIEEKLQEQGLHAEEVELSELDRLWEEAKQAQR